MINQCKCSPTLIIPNTSINNHVRFSRYQLLTKRALISVIWTCQLFKALITAKLDKFPHEKRYPRVTSRLYIITEMHRELECLPHAILQRHTLHKKYADLVFEICIDPFDVIKLQLINSLQTLQFLLQLLIRSLQCPCGLLK